MDKTFLTTFASAIGTQPDGQPVWLQLLPAGSFSARDGRGPFRTGGKAEMEAIIAASLNYAGTTEIMVDYDHQSVFGAINGVGGRAPAAGWIKELQVRDDGIWGRVEWTEAARSAIKAGEYRYLSPVMRHDKKSGHARLIVNAALTNSPAFDLAEVAASTSLSFSTEDKTMDKIIAALGLAEGSGEDACLSAITSLLNHTSAMHTALSAPKGAKPTEIVKLAETAAAAVTTVSAIAGKAGVEAHADATAIMTALGTGVADAKKYVPIETYKTLSDEFTAFRAEFTTGKAEAAVTSAMAAGKITPSQKDWALSYAQTDLKGFEAFAANQPVITTPQLGDRKRGDADTVSTDESDKQVMAALGISEEAFTATRKKEG